MTLLEPKTVVVDDKEFVLSKFPAVEGREIISGYPLSGLPKIGDYPRNQEIMLKLMSYVAVLDAAGNHVRLATLAHVNKHTGNWETLVKLEGLMLEYNCSFLANGRVSSFFETAAQKIPAWITKILMDFSAQSSQKIKRRSVS